MEIIEQISYDTLHRTDALDNSFAMLDKSMEFLNHEVDARTAAEKVSQDSVKTTVKQTTDTHETLVKRVERDPKNLETFQRELARREEVNKKHLDDVHEKISTVQSSLDDTIRQKQIATEDVKRAERDHDHVTA